MFEKKRRRGKTGSLRGPVQEGGGWRGTGGPLVLAEGQDSQQHICLKPSEYFSVKDSRRELHPGSF